MDIISSEAEASAISNLEGIWESIIPFSTGTAILKFSLRSATFALLRLKIDKFRWVDPE
jgi:hypothetical protein